MVAIDISILPSLVTVDLISFEVCTGFLLSQVVKWDVLYINNTLYDIHTKMKITVDVKNILLYKHIL